MATVPTIPDAVRRAALAWQVTLWSGEVTARERHAFERWHAADPLHAAAWLRVQRLGSELHRVPDPIARRVLRTPQAAAATRRRLLQGMGLAAGAAGLAGLLYETTPWQAVCADHRTGTGERRDVQLPDGTRVTLNTASAVDVRYTPAERRLLLRSGEIAVSTAPRPTAAARPFVVETAAGTVRAFGTRFVVREFDASPWSTAVQVAGGVVQLEPVHGERPRRLPAGQQARFNTTTVEAPHAADPAAVAWTRGLLVAEQQRLADFLAELGRYRHGVLQCDDAVAALRVSGVYPLADPEAVLRSLAQALPVHVTRLSRFWVRFGAPA